MHDRAKCSWRALFRRRPARQLFRRAISSGAVVVAGRARAAEFPGVVTMDIIPAIDLRGGQVVRLAQGDYERQTRYPVDPVQLAEHYRASGADWLHVVDLD